MYHYRIGLSIIQVIGVLSFTVARAQSTDLLDELNMLSSEEIVFSPPAFKTLQIGNLQSTKLAANNDLYLNVSHRFGSLNTGIREFYGLDQANTRIQLLYGISDNVQVSLSRDSFEKTYSSALKLRLLRQSNKMPVAIVAYFTTDINTLVTKSSYPGLLLYDRFAYTSQFLVSRRMSEELTIELAPIYVRQNLIDLNYAQTTIPATRPMSFLKAPWSQYLVAVGGRYKLSKRVSLNMDYAYNVSKSNTSLYKNPLAIGFDIETGGHVFQLLFTNSRASNNAGYLTETLGDWTKGEISFGFNVVRVF